MLCVSCYCLIASLAAHALEGVNSDRPTLFLKFCHGLLRQVAEFFGLTYGNSFSVLMQCASQRRAYRRLRPCFSISCSDFIFRWRAIAVFVNLTNCCFVWKLNYWLGNCRRRRTPKQINQALTQFITYAFLEQLRASKAAFKQMRFLIRAQWG